MAETPIPFFGLGAMRAGTTWLTNLLRSYPDCAVASFNELHAFHARYGQYGALEHYRSKAKQLQSLTESAANSIKVALRTIDKDQEIDQPDTDELADGLLANSGASLVWSDEVRGQFFSHAQIDDTLRDIANIVDYLSIRDNQTYVQYLRRNSVGARALGEISPTYSLLPAAGFAEIESLFPGARFIFIMRDPVDRLWSHVRFEAGSGERRGRRRIALNEEFRRAMNRPAMVEMSSYHHTISKLESVIPADRILYTFYERLISPAAGPAEVRRIEAALGLEAADIDPKIFSTSVNASASAKLDVQNEADAEDLFAPVYEFVRERFGLPRQWRSPGGLQ